MSGLIGLVFISACSFAPSAVSSTPSSRSAANATPASPSPSPLATPSIPATLAIPWPASTSSPCALALPAGSPPLMVVLEANGSNTSAWMPGGARTSHDTVVIADINAVGRARAQFQPRYSPGGMSAAGLALSPHEAYVVRGMVYFIDGYGTVFRMGVDGKQAVVTKFPITINPPGSNAGGQEVSFAVSPDGCQLAGTVLTVPAAGMTIPPTGGTWTLQTMRATAGSAAEVLHTWTSTAYPNSPGTFENLVVAGWDSTGPVIVVGSDPVPQNTAYQGTRAESQPPVRYVQNADFFGGAVAHLGGDGTYGAPAGTAVCSVAQVSSMGDITCYQPGTGETFHLSVIQSTGDTELAPTEVPDHTFIAVGTSGRVELAYLSGQAGQWQDPDGQHGALPPNFYPEGSVNAQTIFGRGACWSACAGAALVRIGGSQPVLEDLGFQGDFVGMLT